MNRILHYKKIIIIFLVIIGIVFFVCSFLYEHNRVSTIPNLSLTSGKSTITKNKPVIKTSLLTFRKESSTSVAVIIDSGGHPVSGIQLQISYDPTVLTNISISPGSYFSNPTVLLKRIDLANGTILYVLVPKPFNQFPTSSKGTVATVDFQPIPGIKSDAAFSFLPETKVTEAGIDESVLKQASEFDFPITQ